MRTTYATTVQPPAFYGRTAHVEYTMHDGEPHLSDVTIDGACLDAAWLAPWVQEQIVKCIEDQTGQGAEYIADQYAMARKDAFAADSAFRAYQMERAARV